MCVVVGRQRLVDYHSRLSWEKSAQKVGGVILPYNVHNTPHTIHALISWSHKQTNIGGGSCAEEGRQQILGRIPALPVGRLNIILNHIEQASPKTRLHWQ